MMPEESVLIISGIMELAIDPPMVVSHPSRRSSSKMTAMLDEVRIATFGDDQGDEIRIGLGGGREAFIA